MKNDDSVIPNIPEIKTLSSSSSPGDRVINTTSDDRVSSSNSSNSSSSSPSDLRRRLEDLPSPNEFTLLADRVATLGRRISRKRELFLRLHGVANRIEENDEWEEREQRAAGSEDSLGAFRPKDARARRRARNRLETSSNGDAKAMVISQTGDPTGPSKTTDNDDKSNPAEITVDRSARDRNYLQSSALEVSRRQPRPISLSEPSSTRSVHHNNVASHDTKPDANLHSFRNFTSRTDSTARSVDLPSVAPFSLIRPKKFGGYRPPSGVILKNLSSDSESESANETNRGQLCVQKVSEAVATLELSSPESKSTAVDSPTKKMPIMSARSDITRSILPNLLPSARLLHENDVGNPISQGAYIAGQANHNESSIRFSNQMENVTPDVPAKAFYNKQASCDELATKISNELWHIATKHEYDEQEEISQNTLSFSARSFISEPAELVTSAYNEQINRDLLNNYEKFQRAFEAQFEDERNEQGELGSYCAIVPDIHHDQPDSIERARTGVAEDALSSEISEQFASEDSRLSYAAKMCLQKDVSNRRSQNNIDMSDKYDQEIITVTNVPTLALNSQDISYSTSTGSRECPDIQPLDHHALIKALSNVSLKQERQRNVLRKRNDLYRSDNDTNGVADFPTKGETWRIPRSSISGSPPRKSLTRVPSKIPIRISSSKNISFTNINKLSGSYKNSETSTKSANDEEAQFLDQNGGIHSEVNRNIFHQRSAPGSSYDESSKQYSLQGPRNENIEVAKAHSNRFPSNDGAAEYEANKSASLISSNLQIPQTLYGNEVYDKMGRMSNGRFNGTLSPVFFNETSYSNNRDYAKIDDDARSKSDRSTSRKSMETVDITSATRSPYLPKYKRDSIPRNEEENATWRTEDECASINNEEDPEDLKNKDYYDSCSNKMEEMYPQTKEYFESAIEEIYDWSPSKSQLPQIDLSLEVERIARKQSRANNDANFANDEPNLHRNLELTEITEAENATSLVRRTQEICNFAAKMSSSTLNLSCESRRKRKSQERFPFTISEASGALSTEHVDTSDYQLPEQKHFDRTKMGDPLLEEKTMLKTHPSITRLASSGLEDTVTEIMCCVAQEQRQTFSKSRMRALVRIFTSKLRKTSKRNDNRTTIEPAKIIYENRACQVDSKTNSFSSSGNSSAEKFNRLNSSKSLNNRWIDHSSNFMYVSDGNILKKTENLEVITQEHPRRKYDRDNLWIQNIKDSLSDENKDDKIIREQSEEDDSKRNPEDQYSIFLAKDYQSDKLSKSNNNHNPLKEEQNDMPTSSRLVSADGKAKRDIDQKISPNFPEVEEMEKDLTGCPCLFIYLLCHLFAPSENRLSIRKQVSSSRMKKSTFLLRKRKK